jgi:hypothetical protein
MRSKSPNKKQYLAKSSRMTTASAQLLDGISLPQRIRGLTLDNSARLTAANELCLASQEQAAFPH